MHHEIYLYATKDKDRFIIKKLPRVTKLQHGKKM